MNTLVDSDRFSLIHGEALMTMRHLPGKSFGMVCTDPPYSPHTHKNLGRERRNDGTTVRKMLAFPPLSDGLIESFAGEFVRLCTGWIIICSDFQSSAKWGNALERVGGSWVRTGQWVKTSPMPQMTGDRPACGAEDIVIGHADTKNFEWNAKGRAAIWRGGRDKKPSLHPNQKPVWLIQSILGMFAPKGAVVLDPFFGSGTTAVAALRSDRAPGEVALETTCKGCAMKRAEEYAPPLPVDLKVVGIEGDIDTALKAAERVGTCC